MPGERLDLELADKLNTAGIGGASFQRYAELLQQLRQLQGEKTAASEKLKVLSQLLTYLLVSVIDPNGSLAVTRLREELASTQQHLNRLVNLLCTEIIIQIILIGLRYHHQKCRAGEEVREKGWSLLSVSRKFTG